ncbi:hypothetical protein G9A89_002401 [Geosiphon pyriformis]|nr:hypothetical protein G9A89_002401 [Geosiphon pyriformis]
MFTSESSLAQASDMTKMAKMAKILDQVSNIVIEKDLDETTSDKTIMVLGFSAPPNVM